MIVRGALVRVAVMATISPAALWACSGSGDGAAAPPNGDGGDGAPIVPGDSTDAVKADAVDVLIHPCVATLHLVTPPLYPEAVLVATTDAFWVVHRDGAGREQFPVDTRIYRIDHAGNVSKWSIGKAERLRMAAAETSVAIAYVVERTSPPENKLVVVTAAGPGAPVALAPAVGTDAIHRVTGGWGRFFAVATDGGPATRRYERLDELGQRVGADVSAPVTRHDVWSPAASAFASFGNVGNDATVELFDASYASKGAAVTLAGVNVDDAIAVDDTLLAVDRQDPRTSTIRRVSLAGALGYSVKIHRSVVGAVEGGTFGNTWTDSGRLTVERRAIADGAVQSSYLAASVGLRANSKLVVRGIVRSGGADGVLYATVADNLYYDYAVATGCKPTP